MSELVRILACVGGALFAHVGLVHTLSLVGRRYGPSGRLLNSIMFERHHLIGLSVAAMTGLVISARTSEGLLPYQIGFAVFLLLIDEALVYRAIKAVG